jgi:hypothetical protein
MSKRLTSTEERALEERFRREAIESRPAFSESLHRRILCAVRQHHAAVISVGDRAALARRWRRGWATALAAACVLCAAAISWQLSGSAQRPGAIDNPIPQPSLADLRVIDEWTDQATLGLDGLVASASLKPHAAKLKHDARLVANAFLEPLPVDVQLVSDP